MLNEGIIGNDAAALIKSEMVQQIRRLGPTTPDELEKAVFEAVTHHKREDIDWKIEDNKAGYFLWLKSFDQMIQELIDDGYILLEEEPHRIVPTESVPHSEYSFMAYPPSNSK